MKRLALLAPLLLLFACQTTPQKKTSGPWNIEKLNIAPKVTWGIRSNLVQEVYYESEELHGRPTHVFAYVGRPEGVGPFPAVVLIHGGGGKAFRDWADHWAKRGYV